MNNETLMTSESVTEGHPDKVCDYISDAILDACLLEDPDSRVACETLCKGGHVVLAGEVSTRATLDYEAVARRAIREIGYTLERDPFNADAVEIHRYLTEQSPEIALGVDSEHNTDGVLGAGDQGLMFGYATDETPELMPLPILLAHRLAKQMAQDRHDAVVDWLRPDGKTQVTVRYDGEYPTAVGKVVVSTQHGVDVTQETIEAYVRDQLMPSALGDWNQPGTELLVNPTGSFTRGGPNVDCGLTGRKIIVDTYGGMAPHGGGAFSGKDPSKVDRSAAYFCRHVARSVVHKGLASRALIQVSYAIGRADPQSVSVNTFRTGDDREVLEYIERTFDFRPAAIIETLDLRQPIYRQTTNYGHFGRSGLPWEGACLEPRPVNRGRHHALGSLKFTTENMPGSNVTRIRIKGLPGTYAHSGADNTWVGNREGDNPPPLPEAQLHALQQFLSGHDLIRRAHCSAGI